MGEKKDVIKALHFEYRCDRCKGIFELQRKDSAIQSMNITVWDMLGDTIQNRRLMIARQERETLHRDCPGVQWDIGTGYFAEAPGVGVGYLIGGRTEYVKEEDV